MVLAGSAPWPALAQRAREATRDTVGARADTLRAIPLALLPEEMASTIDFVASRGDTVGLRAAFQQLSQAAEPLLTDLPRREDRADSVLRYHPSIRNVEALLAEWNERQTRLSKHVQDARALGRRLFVHTVMLDSLRAVWRATKEQYRDALTPTRAAAIDSLLSGIEQRIAIESPLSERADTLVGSLLEGEARAKRLLGRIHAQERTVRGELLVRDAPPVWESIPGAAGRNFLAEARTSWNENWQDVVEFVRREAAGLAVYSLLFLGILLLLLFSRGRILELAPSGKEGAVAVHVAGHPAGTAFLLTVVAFLAGYPHAAVEFMDLLSIVVTPFFIRLAWGILQPALRAPVIVLSGLFVLDHLGSLLGALTVGWRASLLIRGVLGAIAFHWIAERLPLGMLRDSKLLPALVAVARVGSLLLAVAALGNLLGYTTLAVILAEGTINSAILGLLFAVVAPILGAVFFVLTRTPLVTASRYLHRTSGVLLSRTTRLSRVLLAAIWIWYVLDLFRLLRPALERLTAILGATFEMGTASISLAGVLSFVLVTWLGIAGARIATGVLEEDILERTDLPRGVPAALARVTQVVLIALVFLVAAAAAGVQLSQLALLTGALGVGIGFGMQNVVNNFISGLILMFERPIQVGDVVQVGELTGTVRKIGFRSSTIHTFEGSSVIVPNGNLVSNEVINWTLSDPSRRIELRIGVAYGTDPEKVIALLVRTAAAHPEVSKDPPPLGLFQQFGDNSLNFVLRYWTENFSRWVAISSEVAVAVNAALAEAGIDIPFPQRTLHVASWDPGARPPLGGNAPGESGKP
jgi:small-conductance mechanosensitive channel